MRIQFIHTLTPPYTNTLTRPYTHALTPLSVHPHTHMHSHILTPSLGSSSGSAFNLVIICMLVGNKAKLLWQTMERVILHTYDTCLTENNAKREDVNLLIVQLSSEHLRCHPVRGPHYCHPDGGVWSCDIRLHPFYIPLPLGALGWATVLQVPLISEHTSQTKVSHHSSQVLAIEHKEAH